MLFVPRIFIIKPRAHTASRSANTFQLPAICSIAYSKENISITHLWIIYSTCPPYYGYKGRVLNTHRKLWWSVNKLIGCSSIRTKYSYENSWNMAKISFLNVEKLPSAHINYVSINSSGMWAWYFKGKRSCFLSHFVTTADHNLSLSSVCMKILFSSCGYEWYTALRMLYLWFLNSFSCSGPQEMDFMIRGHPGVTSNFPMGGGLVSRVSCAVTDWWVVGFWS